MEECANKYRALFESAGDAIFLMNRRVFVDCNRTARMMFGCTQKKIIGASMVHFSPVKQPDGRPSRQKARDYINAALDGKPQRFEWRHCRSDGSLFDVEVSLNRIELKSGLFLQAIVRADVW